MPKVRRWWRGIMAVGVVMLIAGPVSERGTLKAQSLLSPANTQTLPVKPPSWDSHRALAHVKNFSFSGKFLWKHLTVFTAKPHPFGSLAQQELARWLELQLKTQKVYLKTQRFSAQVPLVNAQGALRVEKGTADADNKSGRSLTVTRRGWNVVAKVPGQRPCSVVVGSHYDTKDLYGHGPYLGANDSASSSAGLLELLRFLKVSGHYRQDLCDIYGVFFDGEESVMKDWHDGERYLGKKDHTYGSRYMVSKLIRERAMQGSTYRLEHHRGAGGGLTHPIAAVLILDMIGSKNVQLTQDQNSHGPWLALMKEAARKLGLASRISSRKRFIEDDHIPFMRAGIPSLLMIDFENMAHWHQPSDTLQTIDVDAMVDILRIAALTLFMMSAQVVEEQKMPPGSLQGPS